MSIDERLDRLTDRHEALTQSIELLTLDIREQGMQIVENSKQIALLTGNIDALVHVVRNHQQRLDKIEGA